MAQQTRRDFLKTLLGTAALAMAGSALNGCVTALEIVVKRGENRKYDTIAHQFLDIEGAELGVADTDYQVLDTIIDEAKTRITTKETYDKEEAIDVLRTIDDVLGDMGFKYKRRVLFNPGLKNKQIDCDNYSAIYLAIAEVMDLPLNVVYAPSHVFVRWHFDSDKYFNWETTPGTVMTDKEYQQKYNIPNVSIKNGVFLKTLSEEEFLATAYDNRGLALDKQKKHQKARDSFDQGIKLCPHLPRLYVNKGSIFFFQGDYEQVIKLNNQAIELNPNDFNAYLNKGLALTRLKRYPEALESYDCAIKCNSSSRSASNARTILLKKIKDKK
ncbi:tetratricopeptide repeat protein [Candidatus Woesearchaeota archaeon]|nr:tetratricopeptide repeat protein [Candidatus Woesearchaeota archaeon]